jgi:MFS family permease
MANVPQQPPGNTAFTKQQVFTALSAVVLAYASYSYFLGTLNIAAPKIAADLDAMPLFSWGVSIPGLGLAFGTLMAGKLSDIYGRRSIMLSAMAIFILGAILSALSPTFITLIGARTVLCLGQGMVAPICFAIIGDLFVGADRSRWIGLLNVPFGFFALVGPSMGGWFVDKFTWRYIFWWSLPLMVLCAGVVFFMPRFTQAATRKIDWIGAFLAAIASTSLILGISFAGTTHPWGSVEVIRLLTIAVVCGLLFLWAESKAEEPFLDPKLFKNRTFMTACIAGFLSFVGMMGLQLYYPLLMQGVQNVSARTSGLIITPLGGLMAFIGVPTGFLVARTKRYKWMYIAGYALATVVMLGLVFFKSDTPLYCGVIVAALGGIGLGAMPTVNTIVIQTAVPRKLIGVAMGAFFFSVALGWSISPAILGSALNIQYSNALKASLPPALTQFAAETTMTSLGNPRVLLSEDAMNALKKDLSQRSDGKALFEQTVTAIQSSLEAALRTVFIIGAAAMFLAFLLIITIPNISLAAPAEDGSASS